MNYAIDAEEYEWDAIVIGTGVGGGTIGFKLAEAGKHVLFIEKGKSHLENTNALRGQYAELFFPEVERPEPKHFEVLQNAGRWADIIFDTSGEKMNSYIPFIGSGTGGSSALYGMVMERFFPVDFGVSRFKETKEKRVWPISYADLKPYYENAEKLYRVRGSVDPLRKEEIGSYLDPPALAPANKEIYDFLSSKGFNPYQLPLACEFTRGCQNCQGFLCPENCKNDSAKICVAPAINQYGATLVDLCEVIRLESNNNNISGVICNWNGRTAKFKGKIVILAAGALQTPAILLRSSSEKHPLGLANSSGQVGRNLMRHYIDIYAISVNQKPQPTDDLKQIAFNDLYQDEEELFGTVQSFGKLPPTAMLAATIYRKLKDSPIPFLANVFVLIKPIVELLISKIFSGRLILSSIMEDSPNSENRISISPTGKVVMTYRIDSNERKRIGKFRRTIKNALKPYSYILIKQAESNGRIAHVCGTCRFGNNPEDSVLDAMNRAHDFINLFIVDSSFFPTSGGTNPALTIAANALRVADHILRTWTDKVET